MMMTESYYHGVEYEPAYRSPHRATPSTAHYNRAGPYGYYDHGRYHTRQHFEEQQAQDGELNNQIEQSARRRIALACQRCRKRKIKCTGDPGDGSGCSACKSVGPGLPHECTFIRVKSHEIPSIGNLEMLSHCSYADVSTAPTFDGRDRRASERYHRSRPSIPVLQTRSAFPADMESAIHNSPVDAYTYSSSSVPRQNSLVGNYGAEGYRSWSVTSSAAQPPTTTYCDQHTTYGFAPIQHATQQFSRLPSVCWESSSSLNMGHLNSSLPSQTANNRKLPVPMFLQYPEGQYNQMDLTGSRPLGSFSNPRIPVNGVQTRSAVPWPLDTRCARSDSISSYAQTSAIPGTCSVPMPSVSEPTPGYQFNATTQATEYASSPDLSPVASGPALSTSFDSSSSSSGSGTTVRPHAIPTAQWYPVGSSQQDITSIPSTDRPSSSSQRQVQNMPGLYSFGTTSSDVQSNSPDQESSGVPPSGVMMYSLPVRDTRASPSESNPYTIDGSDSLYQPSIHHPRPLPQHSASIDNLCRQSPFEQQTPRSSTASRMSISKFSGSYE